MEWIKPFGHTVYTLGDHIVVTEERKCMRWPVGNFQSVRFHFRIFNDFFIASWWINGVISWTLWIWIKKKKFKRPLKQANQDFHVCMYHIDHVSTVVRCLFESSHFPRWLRYKQKQFVFQMTKFQQRCGIQVCFVFTRDVSIPVRSSLRSITPIISVTKRAHRYMEWTCTTTENCVTWLLSFFERWIADSCTNLSSWIFQNSAFLDSRSSTLDSRLSILASRNSNVSTFATRESSFENRVETVNLLLSGTVDMQMLFLSVPQR